MPINPPCAICGAIDGVNYYRVIGDGLCRDCNQPSPNTDIEELKKLYASRTTTKAD